MTCSYCQHILQGLSVPHKRTECPYRRSRYCSICSFYGHRLEDCPNERVKAIRKGLSVENIKNRELRIVDAEKTIKSFLQAYDMIPSSRQAENKKMLLDLANSLQPPRLLVLLPAKVK
jgi:hypothetical protein